MDGNSCCAAWNLWWLCWLYLSAGYAGWLYILAVIAGNAGYAFWLAMLSIVSCYA
jgi:hypothetical protein